MVTVDCTKGFYKFLVGVMPGMFKCKVQPDPGPGPGPVPVPAGILKGYGRVNYWMTLSDVDAFMKLLKDSGCNCTHIELFGREEDGWINKQDLIKQQLQNLLASARIYGITVFVNVVNWGSGSLTNQTDSWFQGWLDFIKSLGASNLVVQAAAEWGDSKAANWCVMMENTLAGFALSWNKGSRPSSASSKYKYLDYHSNTVTDLGPADKRVICNTDTSSILNAMQNGGVLGQTFKPDQVTVFGTNALRAGKSVILYGFNHKQTDVAAIETLGKIGVAPDPQPGGDEASQGLDMAKMVVFGGEPVKNARIVSKMTGIDSNTGGFTMRYEPISPLWKPWDGVCDGLTMFAWRKADGTWNGGKFDWKRISATTSYYRGYENIINGYRGHTIPDYGATCAGWLMSCDGTQRTSCGFFKWTRKATLTSRLMGWLRRLIVMENGNE
jgi:hypothetical protein